MAEYIRSTGRPEGGLEPLRLPAALRASRSRAIQGSASLASSRWTRQPIAWAPKEIMSASSSRANRQIRTDGASVSGLVSATCQARAASSTGRATW